MAIAEIITALDTEIKRLQQARNLLTSLGTTTSLHAATSTKLGTKKRKRTMSAEARKKIAEAQRKRWAKQKAAK